MSVVLLSGGVGGARMARGLAAALPAGALKILVNTGDDFDHYGLRICPDLDTVTYTLGGVSDEARGWGRRDESWAFLDSLGALGGETWFQLGDRDLALHVLRSWMLRQGSRPTEVAAHMAARFGIGAALLPMADEPVATMLETDQGLLSFQDYFVRHRSGPRVLSVRFDGAAQAAPTAELRAALADPALEMIVIAPSNPFLSIDPILAVPGLRDALSGAGVPVVAVSPIVGGAAVKGPLAAILEGYGLAVSPASIAAHYRGLLDGFVIDEADAALAGGFGADAPPVLVTGTMMTGPEASRRLADAVLAFGRDLAGGAAHGR
ncbi:2-phospho-L-lactate transferase [Marinibaculum pumilum]|uniref:2-phospho-L-lactate transferase n=1 Tax=Marinibaculum pumilum TaxID=1766165 RepID=A0ABV7KTU8_9PROT